MAGIRIEGNVSGNIAEVANGFLQVVTPLSNVNAGYSASIFENDPGFTTGIRYRESPYVSRLKRLNVGMDTILGQYFFTSTSQHTANFRFQSTTMTVGAVSQTVIVNSSLTGTSGTYATLQTWKYFPLFGEYPLQAESEWAISGSMPANEIIEWGFYVAPTGTVPPDGVYFRLNSTGLTGVLAFNGTEVETTPFSAPTPNNFNRYKIIINRHTCSFWKDDILLAHIDVPMGNPVPVATLVLPLTFMMRNSGTVGSPISARLSYESVVLKDVQAAKPWSHQMAGMGKAHQTQDGDTSTHTSISNWTSTLNTTNPTAAALTNTGALQTGLGGIALVNLTLTAGTDGIIFSYQNPAGSVTQPPKTLYVTGITISDVLHTAITTNPVLLVYGIAYGHTAVSLATAEGTSFSTSPTTKQPRRIAIGTTAYGVGATAGNTAGNGPINATFQSPIVVNPGEFFQIIAKNIFTTAPGAGTIAVAAMVDHYFE